MKPFASRGFPAQILTTIVVLYVGCCSSLPASPEHSRSSLPPHYRVTDLGRLRASLFVMPQEINNLGQVAGWEKGRRGAVARHAFLWHLGRYTDLGPGAAYAINNHGQIVLQKERYNGDMPWEPICNSYLWEKGKYINIGSIVPSYNIYGSNPPSYNSDFLAIAINDKGWVLGGDSTSLWYEGVIQKITPPINGEAINNAGDVAGWTLDQYKNGFASATPKLRKNGLIITLGSPPAHDVGFPSAINDQDEIVGTFSSTFAGDASKAFSWQDGQMALLPAYKGDSYTLSYAVNNKGRIVGKSGAHRGYSHAVLWQNGVPFDLNKLIPRRTGWMLESAHAINDRGQIAGVGTHNGHHFRAFLLTPTR